MLKKPLFDPRHPPASLRHACVTGALLASLFVTQPVMAQQQSITNVLGLQDNSAKDGDSLRLNPNANGYLIDGSSAVAGHFIDITGGSENKLIIGDGADLEVRGSSSSGSIGNPNSALASMGVTVADGGTLTGKGGMGEFSHGVNIGPSGTGDQSHLNQTGGAIDATGGDGNMSYGIRVGTGNIMQYGGTINAMGGDGEGAFGIVTNHDLVQNGGTINATGGSLGNDARGIMVVGGLTQSGGTITATGGSSEKADGIGVGTDLNQSGGTITAKGGSAKDAYGIGVGNSGSGSLTQSGGTITATGGSGEKAAGIGVATNLVQSGGMITATGGSRENADGIGVTGNLSQTGGNIIAYGSDTAEAHGIMVANDLSQAGGTITATGGSAANAKGITAANLTQTVGTINAAGGSGAGAFGMNIQGSASIGGALNTSGQGAVSLAVGGALSFEGASTYSPEINLATIGRDGLVTAVGAITIGPGATLQPKVTGLTGLGSGTTITRTILESDALISGDFDLVSTASLAMSHAKANGDKEVSLTMSYVSPADNLGNSVGPNTRALLGMMAGTGLSGGAQYDAIDAIYSRIAGAATSAEQRALARDAQLHLTPHGTTRVAHFSIDQQDAVQKTFTDNIGALAQGQAGINGMRTASLAAETGTDAGVAARPDSMAWATPVYETGTRHARNGEFRKADQDFGGIAIGVAHSAGDVTFGVQGHYLYGRLRSGGDPYYKAQTDTFGMTAGGRIDRLLPAYDTGRNSTWVQAVAGYSRESLDQTRGSYGARHDSSPDADIWRIGGSVGRDIAAGAGIISPEFGMDYTHVKLDSYTENNNANMLALRVNPDGFDSFRLRLGASGEFPVYGNLNVRGAAFYRYELGDRNMRLESAFAGAPSVTGFTTAGERIDRSSGEVSVGLRYHAANDMALGADYSVRLEDGYTGHQFGLNFAMKF